MNYLEILGYLTKTLHNPTQVLPLLKDLITLIKDLPREDLEKLSNKYPQFKVIIEKLKILLI